MFDGGEYEVIVTDDGTDAQTCLLIKNRYPWVKWVKGPAKGPAANRNNGARQAGGEWLIFIDDDCLPDPQILRQYYTAINNHKDAVVFEGRISADKMQESFSEESPINESGGYLWSCNFMIRKHVFFDRLHGFDERFPYAAMEDVDLHYRLKKEGLGVVFVHSAFVTHPWRKQNKTFIITLKRFESALFFLKKHPEKAKDLNAVYFLRISYSGVKSLVKNSIRYHFRGFGAGVVFSMLHIYFALYVLSGSVLRKVRNHQ